MTVQEKILSLPDLEKKIKGNIINRQILVESGVVRKNDKRRIKILRLSMPL